MKFSAKIATTVAASAEESAGMEKLCGKNSTVRTIRVARVCGDVGGGDNVLLLKHSLQAALSLRQLLGGLSHLDCFLLHPIVILLLHSLSFLFFCLP